MRLPALSKPLLVLAITATLFAGVALTFLLKPTPSTPTPASFVLTAEPLVAPTPDAPQPTAPKDNATTVLELFNPSDKALTNQLNETNLSQQIEQLMATSFVLANCGLITDDDYKNTYYAAIVYAQKTNLAPNQKAASIKVRRIAESAGASYSLIYSKTKCDDPKLATIIPQLKAWQKAYLPNDASPARLQPD